MKNFNFLHKKSEQEPKELTHFQRARYFDSDERFNMLYSEHIREVAAKHWTPMEVAEKAASFLSTKPGAKILDIGSGAGKFCLIAAYHHPLVHFTGVEQRLGLIELCNELKEKLQLTNVDFVNKNMQDEDFSKYDHFYFYNSFYENIPGTVKIDYTVKYDEALYKYYNRELYKKLDETPIGTRIVTYHSLCYEIPKGFEIIGTDYAEYLKYWQRI